MKIDPEFAELCPRLMPEEISGLEESLEEDGCLHPLIVWPVDGDEVLIDGHNRYEICERQGIAFKTICKEFESREDAKEFIIRLQFNRRNLQPFQRAELALKLKGVIAERAKARQVRKPVSNDSVPQTFAEQNSPSETRQEVAALAGVSHETIRKAEVIAEKATPEVKEQLRRGETTINAVFNEVTGASKAAKAVHVGQNTGIPEWYTPPQFLDAARKVLGKIDLDPASSEVAQKQVKARRFFTVADDGLSKTWKGCVWMNPPYTAGLVDQFLEKLCGHVGAGEVSTAIVLVNNSTDTQWFQKATKAASAVCFPSPRIRFLDPDGNPGAPLQGQAFIYFGKDVATFVENFRAFGFCAEVKE